MTLDTDLAGWGELPATPDEKTLAALLDSLVTQLESGEPVETLALLSPSTPALLERGTMLARDVRQLWAVAATIRDIPVLSEVADRSDPFPGEFRIERLVGTGAFGRVYLAQDVQLNRPVALKTLRFPGPKNPGTVAQLQSEAKLLAALRHPNIVQIYAWRQAAGEHYLVLQYVAGGSLAQRVNREGALPWHLAARYVADVAEGLREVHAQGIVHRDVKPANILWDPQRDEALLTDFGVSARLTGAGDVAGTPQYMAPEGFDGRVGPALDVYGLAASLFWLVTAQPPFPGHKLTELLRQVECGLPGPDARLNGVPDGLEAILRAGLSANPARRPGLDDFLAALRGELNQLLADTLTLAPTTGQAAVQLRLLVSRLVGRTFVPVAASQPRTGNVFRDLKRVPPAPERINLQTGDRVRIEVTADRPGFVTVFNVGPTGNLNLLYPEAQELQAGQILPAGQPLHVLDVELTPPAGSERLFALWSRSPLPLRPEELLSLAEQGVVPGSGPYRATRDLVRVSQSVQQTAPLDWQAVVLELEHEPHQGNDR